MGRFKMLFRHCLKCNIGIRHLNNQPLKYRYPDKGCLFFIKDGEGHSTERERLKRLDEHRRKALDEIYMKECQIERLEYLRHEIRKNQKKV